ncbi:MAG: hypothetical protein JWO35_119 [Candidatus Saccharibacteria bacterium]|nr:hypothetical protein [Candidatus Saccharibacteria bacterium]
MSYEIFSTQDTGHVISAVYSGPDLASLPDIFIYLDEDAWTSVTFVSDLPPDMRHEPKESFSIMDALKIIPKLRPHIRDGKFEFGTALLLLR